MLVSRAAFRPGGRLRPLIGLREECMSPSRRSTRLRLAAGLLVLGALTLAGCALKDFPQSTLSPHSDFAWSIQHLLEQLVFWVVVIFVLVEGMLIVTVMRFRSRPGMPEPKHVHGNTALEVAWTIAPALILTFVAVPTV